jgi:hypothetical protein
MANTQHIVGTTDLNLIEAPVTWRAYMICGFASFGGLHILSFRYCIIWLTRE